MALAKELRVVGLMNIQFAVKDGVVFILEVNPRASRTAPFVSKATGVPLSQLHLKKNLLLCCITRGNEIRIPRGGDQIQVGDNVIVVTLEHGLHDLRDIVED